MTYQSKHISTSINCSAEEAYKFASNPENLPKWSAGLSSSIKNINGEWVAESPMGEVKVKFVQKNNFGILDHDVTLPSGQTIRNPMRIFANSNGCEVVFTLFRRPEITDQEFVDDANMVKGDLEKLKRVLESESSR